MNLPKILRPKATLSHDELARGLRMMTWEGMASLGFGSITTSGFLAAFALALGANNFQIGVLAALPFVMQPLQIPTILLVEKLRRRKALAVVSWLLAQILWFPIALVPFLIGVPSGRAVSMLLGLMAIRSALHAVCNCAWNGWIRDLVPRRILGRFFSRRLALASAVAAIFGLGAAFFVEYWRTQVSSTQAVYGYTYVILLGALAIGLASPIFMSQMPEPLMQPMREPRQSLLRIMATPLRDKNFLQLMKFLVGWSFALNLAVPFFAVYMLQRLGLPLTTVIVFTVLGQSFNILFLRVWGPLADRFGSKAVLSLSASLYLLVILGWAFTTMPERHFMTIPMLAVLHVFAGIASAGVTLAVGTIGLKLAPEGQSTPYLAAASLSNNLGSGLGPLAGGLLADFFGVRRLALDFTWTGPSEVMRLGVLNLTGFDFLFGLAFVIGIATLNFLAVLHEEGEAGREVVLGELLTQSRGFSRAVSSVPGLSFVGMFPFSYLGRLPGLDVAIGVTAYELADLAKMATVAAAKGRRALSRIAKAVDNSLWEVWKAGEVSGAHGQEMAQHAARGVMHAAEPMTVDHAGTTIPALLGVLRALRRIGVNPNDAFRGAGHGAIQGASESGSALDKAAVEVMEAARLMAQQTGLNQDTATSEAVKGALAAAASIGPEAVAQVEAALAKDLATTNDESQRTRQEGISGS